MTIPIGNSGSQNHLLGLKSFIVTVTINSVLLQRLSVDNEHSIQQYYLVEKALFEVCVHRFKEWQTFHFGQRISVYW